jgi:Permuted papain-like amidase enzyme, YaeF/YiiX, C92 family
MSQKLMRTALALLMLQGCASQSNRSDGGKYSGWLISLAEPMAPAIGFTIARVKWRNGYLKDRASALNAVKAHLQPLDLLLFSSKGRLTGHAGSGLFGHTALYLGSVDELKAMGVTSNYAVSSQLGNYIKDPVIIESAQRRGVELTTINYVADTDRIVILRPKSLNAAEKRAAIKSAFAHVGGKFDHHFRLDESETLFCTELVDHMLPQLKLSRKPAYGREVILPDDLVNIALEGGQLRFVYGVQGGKDKWHETGADEVKRDLAGANI